jgi:two-component system phosphate regulon sensor histidine kinase PhoR
MAGDDIAPGLIEALPEPVLVVVSGKVAMSNEAARTLLGRHIDGADIRLALRHPAAVERLLSDDIPNDQVELVGVGGPEQRWLMTVAPMTNGMRFVRLTNRSESRAAEQMRVDFVANASHELRTPLATILGYVETLADQADALDGGTRARFTGIIHDEARRMQRLVEDLISLSRIEGERFSPPRDLIELAPMIAEAARNQRTSAAERKSVIEIDIAPDLPPVHGDRGEILQLIENLISNAIRYGREGTPIFVKGVPDRTMVHLSVRDEGEGMAPEHVPRVTERFFRVDPGRSRAQGGTGLGLSIVKHIVERHRGRMRIASQLGEGTTVHVHLPVADPKIPDDVIKAQ